MDELAVSIRDLHAGYGDSVVLDGINLDIRRGETVALLGRNGVGKTTLLSTIMGHTNHFSGDIDFNRIAINKWPIWKRAHSGIALVPQEREIFPSLTVAQNLAVAERGNKWKVKDIYDLFGRLHERHDNLGNQLSGGEQQMLTLGRALMGSPDLLMLDEPLEGLAPVIVDLLMNALKELREKSGMTMILVEQHAKIALRFAPRAIVLIRGKIAFDGPSSTLLNDEQRLQSLIGVN